MEAEIQEINDKINDACSFEAMRKAPDVKDSKYTDRDTISYNKQDLARMEKLDSLDKLEILENAHCVMEFYLMDPKVNKLYDEIMNFFDLCDEKIADKNENFIDLIKLAQAEWFNDIFSKKPRLERKLNILSAKISNAKHLWDSY